jgi:hypothetical protein
MVRKFRLIAWLAISMAPLTQIMKPTATLAAKKVDKKFCLFGQYSKFIPAFLLSNRDRLATLHRGGKKSNHKAPTKSQGFMVPSTPLPTEGNSTLKQIQGEFVPKV